MPRASYGPEERELLETTCARIYSNAVAHGFLDADDPRLMEDPKQRPALDLLVDIGLLRLDDDTRRFLPMDPAAIQSQIVVPLGQQGAELLTESARWADAFNELGSNVESIDQEALQRWLDAMDPDIRFEPLRSTLAERDHAGSQDPYSSDLPDSC